MKLKAYFVPNKGQQKKTERHQPCTSKQLLTTVRWPLWLLGMKASRAARPVPYYAQHRFNAVYGQFYCQGMTVGSPANPAPATGCPARGAWRSVVAPLPAAPPAGRHRHAACPAHLDFWGNNKLYSFCRQGDPHDSHLWFREKKGRGRVAAPVLTAGKGREV